MWQQYLPKCSTETGTHEPNAPTERENKLAKDEALFCTYTVIWHQEKEKS